MSRDFLSETTEKATQLLALLNAWVEDLERSPSDFGTHDKLIVTRDQVEQALNGLEAVRWTRRLGPELGALFSRATPDGEAA